jgi:hypothetical protein
MYKGRGEQAQSAAQKDATLIANLAPKGTKPPLIRVQPAGEQPVNTSFTQINAQASMTLPDDDKTFDDSFNTKNPSECYAPLRHEAQLNVAQGQPLLRYVNPTDAVHLTAPMGTGVVGPVLLNSYAGIPLDRTDEVEFAGFARTSIDVAKARKFGGEAGVALMIGRELSTVNNPTKHTLLNGQVINYGAAKAYQEVDDKGQVITSKPPKTGIIDASNGNTGDGTAAPPVPRVVDASYVSRTITVMHHELQTSSFNGDEGVFHPEMMKQYLADMKDGNGRPVWETTLPAMLMQAFRKCKAEGIADTASVHEIEFVFAKLPRTLHAFLDAKTDNVTQLFVDARNSQHKRANHNVKPVDLQGYENEVKALVHGYPTQRTRDDAARVVRRYDALVVAFRDVTDTFVAASDVHEDAGRKAHARVLSDARPGENMRIQTL